MSDEPGFEKFCINQGEHPDDLKLCIVWAIEGHGSTCPYEIDEVRVNERRTCRLQCAHDHEHYRGVCEDFEPVAGLYDKIKLRELNFKMWIGG
jgi:hypothetical protein